jgi:hypothetical protein
LVFVKRTATLVSAAAAVLLAAPIAAAIDAPTVTTARVPPLYKNCTNFNKKYPHGVGRLRARDKTKGTRVTTFRRSTRLYNIAMRHNDDLDRDKDGIACEKR